MIKEDDKKIAIIDSNEILTPDDQSALDFMAAVPCNKKPLIKLLIKIRDE